MTDNEHTGLQTPSQQLRDMTMLLYTWCADIHLREHGPENAGAEVQAIIELATGRKQRIPWCLAFLHAGYDYACGKLGQKPRFDPGVSCSALAATAKLLGRVVDWQHAQRGDWFVIRGGDTGFKHVGAVGNRPVLTGGMLNFWSVEGNTDEGGSAEGDGAYRKQRHLSVGSVVFIDVTS